MRTSFIAATLLAILAATLPAAEPDATLQRRTQELFDALAPGKADVWNRYLDRNAVITTEDGTVQTKAEFMKDFHALPPGTSGTIAVRDFRARTHGPVAVTTYLLDEHEDYHGHALHAQYRETDTWLRARGDWRIIGAQVIALRSDPPAIRITDVAEDAYVGRYSLAPDITYEIRRNGSQLEGRRGEGTWQPLMVESPDVLFVPGQVRYRKVFQRDATGKVISFADRRESWDLVWTRVP